MRDSDFTRRFKILISERINDLVIDSQRIAESDSPFKMRKLDSNLDMIHHNFNCYAMFFNTPYGLKENVLESLDLLYRIH